MEIEFDGSGAFLKILSFAMTNTQTYDVVPIPAGGEGPYVSEPILQGTVFSITALLQKCSGSLLDNVVDYERGLFRSNKKNGIHDMVVRDGNCSFRWHNCIISRMEPRLEASQGRYFMIVDLEVFSADAHEGQSVPMITVNEGGGENT